MKRLYRSKSDVMIAGVCSGLASYLNVDVTIVRLVFVLLLFTFAGGLWIYLAMWIIVPVEPSAQMDSVDVEAKAESPEPKKVAAPKKTAAKPKPAGEPGDDNLAE